MQKARFRTVRCILRSGDRFLLVVHRRSRSPGLPRWGLPGGHIERREAFEETARRELRQELGIVLGPLHEIGDYRYRGALHKVLGADFSSRVVEFRRAELVKIGWHTQAEVAELARAGQLHAGYEHTAIADFLARVRVTV